MYINSWKKILALVVMVLLFAISIPPSINEGHFNVRVRTMAAGHPDKGIDNTTILQFKASCKDN